MPDALENPIVLILIGAAISLAASVAVTGLQARLLRRNDVREASRASARRLTSVFIGERDSADSADGFLTEAEITVMSMTDRKTRERLAAVLRLLRERAMPELEELSGVRADRARRLLCEHALEVLGAHLRSERLPEVPGEVKQMLRVEEEALSIRSGDKPRPPAAPAEPITKSQVTARPRHTGSKASGGTAARKTTKATGRSTAKAGAKTEEAPAKEDSAFWDD
ncbi:hypothetical protein ACOQFV_03440 [Nocardiopsis changdeensis]|uniref:DUF2746 domain-containing protein n=1 Tax=Nocardiopsis changdeensis TaxID=2831969 RepID=A0ABX8BKA6_9ACTN|nr:MULTISPECIES: hypothetical protein [Nocardiopsis]QUX22669.1 hypothetical protein KGD84_31010 [Nocardiopsis changdeensis]QYX38612.1 hypothetical protein K1J57_08390 [Nocardiopsis sp. MT53]